MGGEVGSKHWNWKGGRKIVHGYIYILEPDHPFCTKQGYVREHRLVMEAYLGRYLEPQEVVHHIDHNITNNNISNLKLIQNQKTHAHHHVEERKRISPMEPRLCGICGGSKTTYRKKDNYFAWRRNPLNREKWLCNTCYERVRHKVYSNVQRG